MPDREHNASNLLVDPAPAAEGGRGAAGPLAPCGRGPARRRDRRRAAGRRRRGGRRPALPDARRRCSPSPRSTPGPAAPRSPPRSWRDGPGPAGHRAGGRRSREPAARGARRRADAGHRACDRRHRREVPVAHRRAVTAAHRGRGPSGPRLRRVRSPACWRMRSPTPARCSCPTTAVVSRRTRRCATRSPGPCGAGARGVDPHPHGADPVPGVTVVTPNLGQAAAPPASTRPAPVSARRSPSARSSSSGGTSGCRGHPRPRRGRAARARGVRGGPAPAVPADPCGRRPLRRRGAARLAVGATVDEAVADAVTGAADFVRAAEEPRCAGSATRGASRSAPSSAGGHRSPTSTPPVPWSRGSGRRKGRSSRPVGCSTPAPGPHRQPAALARSATACSCW